LTQPPEERGPRSGDIRAPYPTPRERDASLRPAGSTPAHDRVPLGAAGVDQRNEDEPVEPEHRRRMPRRYLAQVAAVAAGFLLGVVGYLALRGERPRQIAPAQAPVSRSAPQQAGSKAVPPAPDTSAPTTPVTAASTARPSPFNRSSEANRTVDAGAAAANRTDVQQQVRSVLTRWSDSILDGDVGAHVSLYAPTVGPYFTKKSATRAQIRDDVKQILARYGDMNVYNISDISVTPIDANNAFATFRKHWETDGNKFAGEEREQLKLTRKGADWLIASEREVKVFWVKRK
jgi:hypothetical protein